MAAAIGELLDPIHVNQSIVTIGAAGRQREIAAKIVDDGGDYISSLG